MAGDKHTNESLCITEWKKLSDLGNPPTPLCQIDLIQWLRNKNKLFWSHGCTANPGKHLIYIISVHFGSKRHFRFVRTGCELVIYGWIDLCVVSIKKMNLFCCDIHNRRRFCHSNQSRAVPAIPTPFSTWSINMLWQTVSRNHQLVSEFILMSFRSTVSVLTMMSEKLFK